MTDGRSRGRVHVRADAIVVALALGLAVGGTAACGGKGAAAPSERCSGDRSPPSISASDGLLSGPSGGVNAWFDARVTRADPVLAENHLLLDGVEIPIVRVRTLDPDAHGSFDPTAGRLKPGRAGAPDPDSDYRYVVSFRIPPGTPPGTRQLAFRTCGLEAPERIAIDVLPAPAPVITSIHVVRGEQWPVLFIKGSNLIDAEEILLVGSDDSVSSIPDVTKLDDGQIRAPLGRSGSYEVFVRTRGGVGGGPPAGVVTVR
jgi:hypothetical protein